jgi:sugar-specific transcriptional regulator TrmB
MEIEQYLHNLGLSENEVKVYLACLELGETKIVPVTIEAKLPRTTVFQILDRLKERGLIEIIQKANRRIYVPYPPARILSLLKDQEEKAAEKVNEFKQIFPELNQLYSMYPFQPKVRFFAGEKELRMLYGEILEQPIDEAWFVTEWDKLAAVLGLDFLATWAKKRVKLNIKSKVLYVGKMPDDKTFLPNKEYLRTGKLAPKDFNPQTHTLIFGDNLAYIATGQENFGVVITSREIASSMRIWFKEIWKNSRPTK